MSQTRRLFALLLFLGFVCVYVFGCPEKDGLNQRNQMDDQVTIVIDAKGNDIDDSIQQEAFQNYIFMHEPSVIYATTSNFPSGDPSNQHEIPDDRIES
jgi:hypothetical protein